MPPLDILITIDTEVWPRTSDWKRAGLWNDLDRDIEGRTDKGDYGIGYQMDVLDQYGLKGVFLVESLFSCVTGPAPLRKIVGRIQDRGHEVQLHVHPEWLDLMPEPLIRDRRGRNLADFSEDEQHVLIGRALANLKGAGARGLSAFRAGNYGANHATLRALSRLGIRYDSSYNYCYLGSDCGLHFPEPLIQPAEIEGVWEIPISFFSDFPGHHRHAQLCACSHREMKQALLQAHEMSWQTFVIVSHSFELLQRGKSETAPDPIVVRRFSELCRFLAENRDRFRTAGFNDLTVEHRPESTTVPMSSFPLTALRIGEQLARRIRF